MVLLMARHLKNPQWQCVSEPLQNILLMLGKESFITRFYLAGGTALALQLGHRRSIDLDFFSYDDELLDNSRQEIITTLQKHISFEIIQNDVGSLLLNIGGVAVGFFGYHYPLLGADFATRCAISSNQRHWANEVRCHCQSRGEKRFL